MTGGPSASEKPLRFVAYFLLLVNSLLRYQIALVSDLDTDSKVANKSNTWHSIFKRGTLTWDTVKEKAEIKWTDEAELKGNLARSVTHSLKKINFPGKMRKTFIS